MRARTSRRTPPARRHERHFPGPPGAASLRVLGIVRAHGPLAIDAVCRYLFGKTVSARQRGAVYQTMYRLERAGRIRVAGVARPTRGYLYESTDASRGRIA